MNHRKKRYIIGTVFLMLLGCATKEPVRHLSSDVCLVMPESTSKAEVLSFLGEPNLREPKGNGDETWIYYKKNETLLRKIPGVGKELGSLSYEIVTVSFVGEQVRTCVYRQLGKEEIQDLLPNVKGLPDE